MATGKRASMREGPLAALFRKTAEDPARRDASRAAQPPSERRRRARGAARPQPRRRAAAAAQAQRRLRARGARSPIPTPQERLRHAFSGGHPREHAGAPQEAAPRAGARRVRAGRSAMQPLRAERRQPVLRVVGVGGAGVNAVNRMVEAEIEGVEFLAINTDLQSLQQSAAHETLHIGDSVTRGLGSGLEPRPRPAGRARGVRPHQGDAARLRHDLHRRRRRRRHRHRRRPGRRPDRPRARRADGRDRHPAVPVRGLAAPRAGRGRDRRRWPTRSTR